MNTMRHIGNFFKIILGGNEAYITTKMTPNEQKKAIKDADKDNVNRGARKILLESLHQLGQLRTNKKGETMKSTKLNLAVPTYRLNNNNNSGGTSVGNTTKPKGPSVQGTEKQIGE